MVWDALHGFAEPTKVGDVDVAYFDAGAASKLDGELQARLSILLPGVCWEVTNQANVHEWLVDASGKPVPPLTSLQDGVGTWPEYATCVGVYLDEQGFVNLIAPHGLDDLFELRVRHNPRRASASTFARRIQAKQFGARWPGVTICMP